MNKLPQISSGRFFDQFGLDVSLTRSSTRHGNFEIINDLSFFMNSFSVPSEDSKIADFIIFKIHSTICIVID